MELCCHLFVSSGELYARASQNSVLCCYQVRGSTNDTDFFTALEGVLRLAGHRHPGCDWHSLIFVLQTVSAFRRLLSSNYSPPSCWRLVRGRSPRSSPPPNEACVSQGPSTEGVRQPSRPSFHVRFEKLELVSPDTRFVPKLHTVVPPWLRGRFSVHRAAKAGGGRKDQT